MSIFTKVNAVSPVNQDFIWLAEYADGSYLSEFDLQTKKENSFYSINKDLLIRFGLIGHGYRFFCESDGLFNLQGQRITVSYKTKDKEYLLNGRADQSYKDIITFKDAESFADFMGGGGTLKPSITQYTFGYKGNFLIDGVNFHFKALCKIPFNQPIHMNFWLVSDQELDGQFTIRRNGLVTQSTHAPLKPNIGGELNWIVK